MLRESARSRSQSLIFSGLLAAFWILALAFSHLTLFSGQVIKQFETYSLAESLARHGWNPLQTTIPCDGETRWVLEFPLYIFFAAPWVALFPSWPAAAPLLVFALFLYGIFRMRKILDPDGEVLPWVALATAPVFLRFSTQFLPDPLALALLVLGAGFHLEKREKDSAVFFFLATAVKPTVLPSILFFRWAFRNGSFRIAREVVLAFVWVAPFLFWNVLLRVKAIPNPMHEGGLLGVWRDWAILLNPHYYSKFLVWTVFKGVGVVLAGIGVYGCLQNWNRFKADQIKGPVIRVALWSCGIFPYWLLIRRLNVIHDYYSLSFFFPIALLGALSARASKKNQWVFRVLLGLSIAQGVGLFIRSGVETPKQPVDQRPVFCGSEFRSSALMGLPKASH